MTANEFRCANCGGVFEKQRSEEDAIAEFVRNGWGDTPRADMALVCDDCFTAIMGPARCVQ